MRQHPSDKKKEEREALNVLLRIYPEVPNGRIFSTESPDFVIQHGTRARTGIELTRFTKSTFNMLDSEDHFHPALNRDALIDLIRAKEEKLRHYQQRKLEEIWLVILVNGFNASPAFNIQNQVENLRIQSGFDRVLVLDLSRQKVYKIL